MNPTVAKEKHGARPAYPVGTVVKVGDVIGVVVDANTNIDGSECAWEEDAPSSHYLGERLGFSHAWRPAYAVNWRSDRSGLKPAWWYAHEWDSIVRVDRTVWGKNYAPLDTAREEIDFNDYYKITHIVYGSGHSAILLREKEHCIEKWIITR